MAKRSNKGTRSRWTSTAQGQRQAQSQNQKQVQNAWQNVMNHFRNKALESPLWELDQKLRLLRVESDANEAETELDAQKSAKKTNKSESGDGQSLKRQAIENLGGEQPHVINLGERYGSEVNLAPAAFRLALDHADKQLTELQDTVERQICDTLARKIIRSPRSEYGELGWIEPGYYESVLDDIDSIAQGGEIARVMDQVADPEERFDLMDKIEERLGALKALNKKDIDHLYRHKLITHTFPYCLGAENAQEFRCFYWRELVERGEAGQADQLPDHAIAPYLWRRCRELSEQCDRDLGMELKALAEQELAKKQTNPGSKGVESSGGIKKITGVNDKEARALYELWLATPQNTNETVWEEEARKKLSRVVPEYTLQWDTKRKRYVAQLDGQLQKCFEGFSDPTVLASVEYLRKLVCNEAKMAKLAKWADSILVHMDSELPVPEEWLKLLESSDTSPQKMTNISNRMQTKDIGFAGLYTNAQRLDALLSDLEPQIRKWEEKSFNRHKKNPENDTEEEQAESNATEPAKRRATKFEALVKARLGEYDALAMQLQHKPRLVETLALYQKDYLETGQAAHFKRCTTENLLDAADIKITATSKRLYDRFLSELSFETPDGKTFKARELMTATGSTSQIRMLGLPFSAEQYKYFIKCALEQEGIDLKPKEISKWLAAKAGIGSLDRNGNVIGQGIAERTLRKYVHESKRRCALDKL